MRVTIYQPQYFPRLHYFNRILNADTFVVLDSAQYTKSLVHFDTEQKRTRHKSYQADTPIKLATGPFLLTVPVKHDGLTQINETGIDYIHGWQSKHLAILKANYAKSAAFKERFPEIETLLKKEYASLADLSLATIIWGIATLLNENVSNYTSLVECNALLSAQKQIRLQKIVRSSELSVQRPEGLQKGTEWTTAICKELGADEYFHGGTAQAGYMDDAYYKKEGIKLVTQDWKCNQYPQNFTDKIGFSANLSILDLLLNLPSTEARSIVY